MVSSANPDTCSEIHPGIRSAEEILSIAEEAANKFFQEELSRSTPQRTVNREKDIIEVASNRSRSSNPVMYAVDYDDDNGFALISANRNAPEIIAIVEQGNFTDVSEANIPGFNIFMKDATAYLNGNR